MATNTTVVAAGRRALVIDPGVHLDELESLAVEVLGRRLDPVGGFATHAHWDHVLWHPHLGEVPRWASAATVHDAVVHLHDNVDQAEAVVELADERPGLGLTPVADALPWEGPEAVLVTHDAHACGHSALHLPELGVLVAGDMGSDIEVPLLTHGVPGPQALIAHHEALDRLAALDRVDVVVTGHGHVCDGVMWRRRLDADRRYLDDIAVGRPTDDTRLVEPWLVDADAGMRSSLTKPAWRQWVRTLEPPTGSQTAAVRDGLAVLTVNFKDGAPAVRRFLEAVPLTLPVLMDRDGAVARAWGVTVFPTTLMISRRGRPVAIVRGEVDWTGPAGRTLVEQLLAS